MSLMLDSGDKIRGDASAATVVDYTIHGLDANALKQLADGQLPSSIGDLFTADSVDVVSLIILVNTDGSARTVNLYLTPNSGTARNLIPKDMSLGAGSSLHFDGAKVVVMDSSGQILSTWAVDDTAGGTDGLTTQPPSSNAFYDHVVDTTTHGATGAVVGTTNTQTLSAKTLTAPTINGTVTLGSTPLFDVGAGYVHVTTTGDTGLYLTRTGATESIAIKFDSAAANAASEITGIIYGIGEDDAAAEQFYAYWKMMVEDPANASPDGKQSWANILAGSFNADCMELSSAGTLHVDENILVDEYIRFIEMAAPGAPVGNTAVIYAIEGAGDAFTDLIAKFQDGSTDKFAEETTPDNSPLFVTPSGTPMQIRLKKDHPGLIRVVAVFPSGEEFDLKCHEFHDAAKIAANVGCDSPLPTGWEVTTLQERVDKNVAKLDKELALLPNQLIKLDAEFTNNNNKLESMELTDKDIKSLQSRQMLISMEKDAMEEQRVKLELEKQVELERLN